MDDKTKELIKAYNYHVLNVCDLPDREINFISAMLEKILEADTQEETILELYRSSF